MRFGGEIDTPADTPTDSPAGSPRKTILKISAGSTREHEYSADLSVDVQRGRELSYDEESWERSITKKLTLDCPARFHIQKNQHDEVDWVTNLTFCDQARRDVHKKVAKARSSFCRRLRTDYPVRALYARQPYDERMSSVPPHIDPRTAGYDDLLSWLQSDRCHRKAGPDFVPPGPASPSGWKRINDVTARTQCWEPTILARRATGMIWSSRLAGTLAGRHAYCIAVLHFTFVRMDEGSEVARC